MIKVIEVKRTILENREEITYEILNNRKIIGKIIMEKGGKTSIKKQIAYNPSMKEKVEIEALKLKINMMKGK